MILEPVVVTAVVGVVALALVVTVLIVRRTVDVRPAPSLTAQRYLHAIAAGDAAAANGLFDAASVDRADLPTATDRVGFMAPGALGSAIERISDIAIGRVTRATGSDSAVVYVSFTLAGERHTDLPIVLRWERSTWRITKGLWQVLQVRPVFTGESPHPQNLAVLLGEASPGRPDLLFEGSFLAYPGVYPFTIESVGWIIEPGSSVPPTVTLAGGRATVVRPRFIPAP